MSKEFEEVVLNKLDALQTQVGKVETEVDGLKTQVGDLQTKMNKFETEVDDLKTQVGNLSIEVKETGDVVQYLNQNFTKFDFEIN